MEFIVKLLAQIFATFKAKNPAIAAIVLLAASTAVYTVANGELYGLFTLPDWGKWAVEVGGLLVTALTGSQTYQYLQKR